MYNIINVTGMQDSDSQILRVILIVITKHWLYSLHYTTHPVAYIIHDSLYLLLSYSYTSPPPSLFPLITTGLFSMFLSLFPFLLYSLVCCMF